MVNCRIVTDSSANLLPSEGVELGVVPLHVIVGQEEFIDNQNVDLTAMQQSLKRYKGRSSTACPGPAEWISEFNDADVVFCVTITSGLSGCCDSARTAKAMYESEHPGKVVYVVDSLSTGPEMVLLVEKLMDFAKSESSHEEVFKKICDYQKRTHLFFSLASVDNFAKNGRINPILAKGIGMLGIRILGTASSEGQLQIVDKCRGDKSGIRYIVNYLAKKGYNGSKIIIAHNGNPMGAAALLEALKERFGHFEYLIHPTRALCSYYAEPESLLVGFEGA